MTDADLIAALGWKPCKRYDDARRGCATHPDDGGMWVQGDLWCLHMMNALLGARAGIDLARNGIVQAIATTDRVSDPDGYIREAVCEIALEWQP